MTGMAKVAFPISCQLNALWSITSELLRQTERVPTQTLRRVLHRLDGGAADTGTTRKNAVDRGYAHACVQCYVFNGGSFVHGFQYCQRLASF